MSNEQRYMLCLLASALNGMTPSVPPDGVSLFDALKLADRNGVAALCAYAAQRLPHAPSFCRDALLSAERADTLRHVLTDPVLETLRSRGIPYCPLKGVALQGLYPVPYLREMSDVDLLVRERDQSRAGEAFLQNGFSHAFSNEQHDVYTAQPDVCAEVHGKLTSVFDRREWFAGEAWQLTEPDAAGGFRLIAAQALVYAVIHMDKHLRTTGIGARAVTDLYLIRHRLCTSADTTAAEAVLQQLELTPVYRSLCAIGEAWFSGAPLSAELEEAASYILFLGKSGMFRRSALYVMQSDQTSAHGLRLKYLLFETFPNRRQMALDYRILTKCGALLPFCWVHRIVRLLLHDRAAFCRALKNAQALSPDKGIRFQSAYRALYGEK